MASPPPQLSPLLNLAREIRDIIFSYAVSEDAYDIHAVRDGTNYRIKRIPIGTSDRWQWEAQHTSQAPIPEYLCLQLVNRQLNAEVREYLSRPAHLRPTTAKMTMLLDYPKLFPTFTSIPQPPRSIRELDMLLRVDQVFHPAYISLARGSQNAILSAVSDTLKRYIHRGPHLARPSYLHNRLHLDTVRITVAASRSAGDVKHQYGLVDQQLESLYTNFMALLRRFSRSGLPWGMIDAFEVRLEGRGWDRVPVTSNIWDEEDFVFFQYGGFNWDGDTAVIQPDLIAW